MYIAELRCCSLELYRLNLLQIEEGVDCRIVPFWDVIFLMKYIHIKKLHNLNQFIKGIASDRDLHK